jgi:hypothetical protein
MRAQRRRLLLGSVLAAGLAPIAIGGVAFSDGRGIRTAGAIGPYTAAHDGVVVNAGVKGEARTRTRNRRTEVRLRATGLPHNAQFGAQLYVGRCRDYGPRLKFDPKGPGNRENEVWLDLRTGRSGEARDRVSFRPVPRDQYSIVIHERANPDPGSRIACGDLEPD